MCCRRILSVLACLVRAPKCCTLRHSLVRISHWTPWEDKWELLPDSGNVIRHVLTWKYLGASLIPLDSTVTANRSGLTHSSYMMLPAGYGIFMIVLESWKMYGTPTYTMCSTPYCIVIEIYQLFSTSSCRAMQCNFMIVLES